MFIKIAELLLIFLLAVSLSQAKSEEEIPTPNTPYVAPEHQEFHWWYKEIQKQLNITGCCDEEGQDCGPVSQYQTTPSGMVKVLMEDGNWYLTGTAKIFYVSTPDGRAHVCRQPKFDYDLKVKSGGYNFYCVFIPLQGV